MPTLYIANATPRDHHLHYRLKGEPRVYERLIPKGTQYKIPHEQPAHVSEIVKQISTYGARTREDVGRDKAFSGIIYDYKPISIENIRAGLAAVDEIAIERAHEERLRNVISGDATVAKLAQEAGTGVGSLEIKVEELPNNGKSKKDLQVNKIQVDKGEPKSKRARESASSRD